MSSVCMPTAWPVCMLDGIWWILFSRIRLRTAGVPIRISRAAIRPPARLRSSVCVTTA